MEEKKHSLHILFLWTASSLLFGIGIHNITQEIIQSMFSIAYLGILFLFLFTYTRKHIFLFIIICLSFVIGIYYSDNNLEIVHKKLNYIELQVDKKSKIHYQIQEIYKKTDFSIIYKTKLISIDGISSPYALSILVEIPMNYPVNTGNMIESEVKIEVFEDFNGFSYKKYMLSRGLYGRTKAYAIEIISSGNQNIVSKKIESIRNLFLEKIFALYPKNEAIFLGGILIGARENLPKELKTNFNNSGLTHFIAVSGFNITILILFFSYLLQKLPTIIRLVGITIAIVLFTLLVGDTAPVIRASLMGLIAYYILLSGRQGNVLAIILFVALIMVLWSPLSINYDVSLHLSFLAVIGIIYTQKFFDSLFQWVPNFLEMRTALVLTLAALSFSLPIMIFNFGQVSIMAPIANIAVTWTIPLAMLAGFISIVVSFVFPFIGNIIGYFTWVLLKWDMIIVKFFGELEWSVLETDFGIYSSYYQIIYFILLSFIILYYKKRS